MRNYGQLLGEIRHPLRVTFMTRPLGMRWLLGVFEAGLFPGGNYYLSWCVAITALSLNLALL